MTNNQYEFSLRIIKTYLENKKETNKTIDTIKLTKLLKKQMEIQFNVVKCMSV